ncbi:MAG TPA: homoserine kinase [Rectinemataceae bacterium]|nr:homoserine kinase [Rectinemataceae bacterium]
MKVSVPATSANLGPGFDALGLALSLRNEFHIETADSDELVGCDPAFAGADNLFLVAARRAAVLVGLPLPPLRIRFASEIPIARGLGSSATLIVGGILAARRILGSAASTILDEQAILDLAASIEGHPDNTTPALLGGFSVAVLDAGRTISIRRPLGQGLVFSALVPPFALETTVARAALPSTVPFPDAAANAGRAALVTAAFLAGDWHKLGAAMRDRLHEPWRAPLIPGYDTMTRAAREAGALAVWLSGAGPTIIAASRRGNSEFAKRMDELCRAAKPQPWRHYLLGADDVGASVTG